MNTNLQETVLDKSNLSVAFVEALDKCCMQLEREVLPALKKKPDAIDIVIDVTDTLGNLVKILDEFAKPIEAYNDKKAAGIVTSEMRRLGVEGEALELRRRGLSGVKISETLGVSHEAVKRFFKTFDSLRPAEKAKYNESSVMNTTARLEELMNMILRRLHSLEGIDDELHVKYIGEFRQTLQLASQVAEKIVNYKKYQDFTESVWEILKTELPHRRSEILAKIKEQQQLHRGVLPGS